MCVATKLVYHYVVHHLKFGKGSVPLFVTPTWAVYIRQYNVMPTCRSSVYDACVWSRKAMQIVFPSLANCLSLSMVRKCFQEHVITLNVKV